MFVAVVRFPSVPPERDADLRDWFAWSNQLLQDEVGLAGRRLLRGADGSYVGIVEHESQATFAQMHSSPAAAEVQQRLHGILDGRPEAELYDVVVPTAGGGCCGETDGHAPAAVTSDAGTAGSGSCCQAS